MALITDPDNLSQGASTAVTDIVFGTPTGAQVTITSAGTGLPSITAGDYFEIRDHSDPENNGLYLEDGGAPTTGSITASKQTGVNPVANAVGEAATTLHTDASTATEKSVFFDTLSSDIYLLEQGLLSTDGATIQALYSFAKEEWKDDPALIPFDFPFVAVTPEQFEFVSGWTPSSVAGATAITEKLLRTGGWSEIDELGNLSRQWFGCISLGSFEDDATDNAYYEFGNDPTVDNTVNFEFPGPENEAVLTYEDIGNPATFTYVDGGGGADTVTRASGSFIDDGFKVGGQMTTRDSTTALNDGTYTITGVAALTLTFATGSFNTGEADPLVQVSVDNRNAFAPRLRVRDGDPNGKSYDASNLTAIGLSTLTNKAERFPLSNATDLKISETDANIDTISPYTEIRLRYLAAAYNREVDTTTKRDFGIIVDVGTYSQSQGASASSTLFTSASLSLGTGEALADYVGGTLFIHEGTDQGSHTISGTPVDNAGTLEITLTVALTATESNLSFTMQRATPVVATAEEIYEKVQRELRQTTDIDQTSGVVIGRVADSLLTFVGDTLNTGVSTPSNPNGGGSGVFIEGFDSNDTNRLGFTDNAATLRNFPFVAAGTISFNPNLVNDSAGSYWMFFTYTTRTAVADLAISSAVGDDASIDSAGSNFPAGLAQNDHVTLSGFVNEENNGVWIITDAAPSTSQFDARKMSGDTVVDEAAVAGNLDENPINSPDAILVDNNAGTDISGTIGAASVGFDFDYDGNTQGGRTAATDAAITLRAIGLETGQYVETTGTITRNTGLSFSLVAGLERNYSNP